MQNANGANSLTSFRHIVKNTNHFIRKVNNYFVPVKSILVTRDIISLYSSVPKTKRASAMKKWYENYIYKSLPIEIITIFQALILTLNNFKVVLWVQFTLQHTQIFSWLKIEVILCRLSVHYHCSSSLHMP